MKNWWIKNNEHLTPTLFYFISANAVKLKKILKKLFRELYSNIFHTAQKRNSGFLQNDYAMRLIKSATTNQKNVVLQQF